MSELERRLLALGRELDLPAATKLGPRVTARLAERPRRRRRLALVLVALAVAIGAAFAVPQARTAILDWLGIGGIELEQVQTLPQTAPSPDLRLGPAVSLTEARRRAGYPVAVPSLPGAPQEVRFAASLPGAQVALIWWRKDSRRPRLLLTQFRADGLTFIEKSAGPGTRIERLSVGGDPAVWLTGNPHFFAYLDPETDTIVEETSRLAGNVLLWQRGDVTLRLEGARSKAEALAIATSVE